MIISDDFSELKNSFHELIVDALRLLWTDWRML